MRKKLITLIGSVVLGLGCVAGSAYVEGSVTVPQVKSEPEQETDAQIDDSAQVYDYSAEEGTTVMYPSTEITCDGRKITWDEEKIKQRLEDEAKKQEMRQEEEVYK